MVDSDSKPEYKLASDGWKQFMDDIEAAKDKIHLYQLVSKHVRNNTKLRDELYSIVNALFSKVIKDKDLATKILEQFYMDLLEAKASFFDSVSQSGQLGLAVAPDGEAMRPPIPAIINSLFGDDETR